MKITILTLFPEMVEPFFRSSIMKRAVEKGIIEYSIVDIRDFAEGVHRKADDIPYGGGAGMVMMAAPVAAAIKAAGIDSSRVIVQYKGDTANPFSSPEQNRVAICVVKCFIYE